MPLVKMIRGGQVTFPKAARDRFGLKEGDLMEYEIQEEGIFFKPKIVLDKGAPLADFSKALERIQAGVSKRIRGMEEEELSALIEAAIAAARKGKRAKKGKARKDDD